MATINTLDGPLDTAELGTVLMHEHVFNLTAEIQIAHPCFNGWNPDREIPKAQQTLSAVKQAREPAPILRALRCRSPV